MKSIQFFLLFLLILCCKSVAQYNPPKDLGNLFVAVQTSRIFPDSKTFVDCIPRHAADSIVLLYNREKIHPGFDLKTFVTNNFVVPPPLAKEQVITHFPDIETHIQSLWEKLERKDSATRGSLIILPHPYVVPGGRFNEMYYWDSYFTMLGLQVAGRTDLIRDMTDNFAYLLLHYGIIPNGTRTYYLSRSQPPFFALMVSLLAEINGDSTYIHYLPPLLKEYRFWMEGSEKTGNRPGAYKRVVVLPDKSIMNRYWDNDSTPRPEAYKEDIETASSAGKPVFATYRNIRAACESGWDFSSRWFGDGISLHTIRTTDLIPVDLNCLLYYLETTLSRAFGIKGDETSRKLYLSKAEARKKAILTHCWNPVPGFFTDYDVVSKHPANVCTLAGLYPLYFLIADKKQAEKVAGCVENHFLYPGGLLTTFSLTRQQWDAPNGWAPLQWMSCEGLRKYGYTALDDTIEHRWIAVVEKEYGHSGKLLEKYNVLYPEIPGGGGEYPSQDGFGWTNAVYLKMKQSLKEK